MDTAIMSKQIIVQDNIIRYKDAQLVNLTEIKRNNEMAIAVYESSYKELQDKHEKLKKKNKTLKQTSLSLGILSCLLGILVIVK